MNVVERAKAILLQPAQTWPVIDAEPATVQSIYKDWLVIMAAIPAVCGFIGLSLVGASVFGISYREPLIGGVVKMLVTYGMSLAMAYVMSLIVDALAPSFGATKNPVGALKVVAYGSTAAYVAGIFSLLPMLSMLGVLVALYSLYLFYLGLPAVMKCPQDKAIGYTAVVVIIAIVLSVVVGVIAGMFTGFGALSSARHAGAFSMKGPDGSEVTIDTTAIDAAAKRMEAARARVEAAQKSGDPASAGAAASEMLGALTGTGGTPIPPADLKAQLPEALGALKRESFETNGATAMGMATSTAKATYTGGDNQRAEITITDAGGLGGLASLATWANVTVDKETPEGIEKTYKDGNRTIHEQYRKDGSHSEYTVILKNGVIFESQGDHIDGATLKSMASAINLDAIEAMKRPAKT
jgi:hypothetical protein